jgi:hypothetical protein
MNDALENRETLELLLLGQQHIHENIKFADQKAGAIIGINMALLSAIYALIDQSRPFTIPFGGYVALVLAAAIAVAVGVIWPRGSISRARGPGVVDAGRISRYLTLEAYLARASSIPTAALISELRTFIYDRACIDAKKYSFLRVSLLLSSVGWSLAFVFVVSERLSA